MSITVAVSDIKRRLALPGGDYACTMVNAGDTISCVLHGRTAGDVLTFSATTGGVVVGTKYYVINVTTADVFQISATRGGAAFVLNADGANTYTVLSEYDGDIGSLITELQAGLAGALDTAALAAYEAAIKLGYIDVMSGEFLNVLRRKPGYAEAVSIGSDQLGALPESGDKLIEAGLAILAPYAKPGYARLLADLAGAAYDKAMAEARDDHAVAIATAEKDLAEANADKVAADAVKLGSEKLLVDAQSDTEAAKPAKVAADTALSTALTAESAARTALKVAQKAQIDLAVAAASDGGQINNDDDLAFTRSSSEWNL